MLSKRSGEATRSRWAFLVAEAFLIVFSVLLALALDEWRQGVAEQRRVARVLETIHEELARNRAQIEDRLPYHENMRKATEQFVTDNIMAEENLLAFKRRPHPQDLGIQTNRGLNIAGNLRRVGWELAINSGALEHMEFETMLTLSRVYALQEEEEEQKRALLEQLNLLYRSYYRTGDFGGELQSFSTTLVDVVLQERALLAAYDRALKMTDGER